MVRVAWRRWPIGICISVVIGLPVAVCAGATYEWTNPVSGTYSTAANWNRTVGSGTPPPVAGDTALLNEAGTYTVTYSANAACDVLTDTAGTVTLASNSSTLRTYSLTTGTASASITGSTTVLNVGNTSLPMVLSVGNNLTVNSGGTLNVRAGSSVSTFDLFLGTAGSGLTSSTIVDGAAASFTKTSTNTVNMGQSSATGVLTFRNGATGDINGTLLVTNSGVDTTAAFLNVESGATLQLRSLTIGAFSSTAATGTVTVTGSGSSITQTGTNTLTIGTALGNVGKLNINSSGTFNTGTGLLTVNKTGTVTIGSVSTGGTFNANGNVTIDGGLIDHQSGSFNLAAGKTMKIQNGGRFTSESYTTATNAIYNISDANSKLETTGGLHINNGAQVNVSGSGRVTSALFFDVGKSSNGTLSVTGSGSTANAGFATTWGDSGGTATVTFSSDATGTFDNVDLASSTTAGTMANVTVDSGAMLTTGPLALASINVGATNTSATLTVTGAGSIVSPTSLNLGGLSGTATLNVTSGGSFVVSGSGTNLSATGTLNINGGTVDLKTLSNSGGTINFTAGSLSYGGDLTVGTGGLLGTNLTLNSDRSLTLTGTTTLDAGQKLTVGGGSLSTGRLVGDGTVIITGGGTLAITGTGGLVIGSGQTLSSLTLLSGRTLNVTNATTIDSGGSLTLTTGGVFTTGSLALQGGTLTIQNTGRTIAAPITGDSASTINIQATNVALGSAASFAGFNYQGVLNVSSNAITLNSAGYARLGALTTLAGGTITAPNGVTFASGSNLQGNGTIAGRVTGELGAVIEAGGALALGDAASPAGFNFAGELRTKEFIVTLNSSGQAGLGNLTTLGNGGIPGTITATNGFIVDFGSAVTGFGTLSSTNTLAKRSIVNGTVQGNSPAQPITLSGWIKGVGSFNNVTFTGTFDPGLSPTITDAGNLALAGGSTLILELGGTTPGSGYDQINATGSLTLDGTLAVSLVNGFTPAAGQAFDILDWGSLAGAFAAVQLPALGAGLTWNTSQLYTTGVLSVAASALLGDYNRNGVVDAADYTRWRDTLGQMGTGLAADGNGNGTIDAGDYIVWQTNFGNHSGSGAGATAGYPRSGSASASVPEPGAAVLLLMGSIWFVARGRVGKL
jgi:hypothetical protein